MTINRAAAGVVLPAILAMLVALLLTSRTASAQDATPTPPPAPKATKTTPPSPPAKPLAKPQPRKETRDEVEQAHRPFQSSSSLKVIRYGRASRAYY